MMNLKHRPVMPRPFDPHCGSVRIARVGESAKAGAMMGSGGGSMTGKLLILISANPA
jgi:hypothetical protein